ncbi:TIM barrel protein [Paenarthrobacter sp. S56]|uniref:sugar phosphate isomerase/epimerase family protein n=1 Tax=Paenarthrobacter sp. S56 TaxID=3138179 RepID=UPI00321A8732
MNDPRTPAQLTPGICSVTLRAKSIDEVVRIAADAGLAGVEWGTDVHVSDSGSAARAKAATEEAGLTVLSLGSYYRAGDFGDFGRDLALAEATGAPRVRIWAGALGSQEAGEDHWAAVAADTRRVAGLAADRGITIAFEYHGNTLTDSPRHNA